MKIIIVYNSKTGFTKRYAEWIAEEMNCDILPYKEFTEATANGFDIIIFGSRLFVGKVEYLDKIKSYISKHPEQKLIVFATGATPAAEEETINKIWTDNFSETEIKTIPHYYMQGGLDYGKMGFADGTMMKVAAKLSKDPALKKSYDIASRKFIAPLLNHLKKDSKAFYYRADLSGYTEAEYPVSFTVNSASELHDYYENNKGKYQFDNGYYGETSMADDMFLNASKFGEAFFNDYSLLFVVLEEGSGSVRHKVESISAENGSLSVNITKTRPEIGTADIAHWHIVLALDKSLSEMQKVIIL